MEFNIHIIEFNLNYIELHKVGCSKSYTTQETDESVEVMKRAFD